MVRRGQHNHARVRVKSVELVEEESPVIVINHRVEVFEHYHARSRHARALEDFAHVLLFRAVLGFEAADVKARLAELIDQRLERMCFSIPRWTNENRATLPWNVVALVDFA